MRLNFKTAIKSAVLATALTLGQQASAATFFFGDVSGNVGRHDTTTGVTSAVGSFTGPIGQIIGLAFDSIRNVVIATDRSAPRVLAMNPITGAMTTLFSGSAAAGFQGAAVIGDILYGIDEISQRLKSFDLVTNSFTGLGTAALTGHSHALGVNTATGQLLTANGSGIVEATMTGTGATVAPYIGSFLEDLDYFGGDFLGARYTTGEGLLLIDGVTGSSTPFLTAAQIDGVGVTGPLSGVAVVQQPISPVPVPASLPLLVAGLAAFGVMRRRRH